MRTRTSAGPIAAGMLFAVVAALPTRVAHAASCVVTNCNDSGPGSLRAVLGSARAGRTVDLRNLRCHRIVLAGGELQVRGGDLAIVGPGRNRLTIDAAGGARVFHRSSASGRLVIRGMTLTNGWADSGGCIRSGSDLELRHVRLDHCRAQGAGGGAWTGGELLLAESEVYDNVAGTDAERSGPGGGVYAQGPLVVYRSTVERNRSRHDGGGVFGWGDTVVMYSSISGNRAEGWAGRLGTRGSLRIDRSTISGNVAPGGAGGIQARAFEQGASIRIVDSTVSGNRSFWASAMELWADTTISGSTIAFNYSAPPEGDETPPIRCTAAVDVRGGARGLTLRIASSIIAGNTCFMPEPIDLRADGLNGGGVLGVANIVGRASARLPSDTLSMNLMLAPLADNGGPTPTHALLPGSPAIDRGANVLERAYDQRGPGFPRVKGARADIGAYEF